MVDVEKLRALKALLDDGTLTEEEYEAAKAQVLAEARESSSSPPPPPPPAPPDPPDSDPPEGRRDHRQRRRRQGGRSDWRDNFREEGQPMALAGWVLAIATIALTLGIAILLYRLTTTIAVMFMASLVSDCCMCGAVKADDITGGFGGAWEYAGELFDKSDGDTLGQIVYFGAAEFMTSAAYGMMLLGLLGVFVGVLLARVGRGTH